MHNVVFSTWIYVKVSSVLGSMSRCLLKQRNGVLGFMPRWLINIGNFNAGITSRIYVKAFLKARSEPPCIMLSLESGSMSRCL